jgi:hypothetical protein
LRLSLRPEDPAVPQEFGVMLGLGTPMKRLDRIIWLIRESPELLA